MSLSPYLVHYASEFWGLDTYIWFNLNDFKNFNIPNEDSDKWKKVYFTDFSSH